MRRLIAAVVFLALFLVPLAVVCWVDAQKAKCVSCPEWSCMVDTHCGGSVRGCWCLKTGVNQLGVCVSGKPQYSGEQDNTMSRRSAGEEEGSK